jgi:hypothetical protein
MTTNPRRFITVPGSSTQQLEDYIDYIDTETLGLLFDDEDNNIGDEAFVSLDAYL